MYLGKHEPRKKEFATMGGVVAEIEKNKDDAVEAVKCPLEGMKMVENTKQHSIEVFNIKQGM